MLIYKLNLELDRSGVIACGRHKSELYCDQLIQ